MRYSTPLSWSTRRDRAWRRMLIGRGDQQPKTKPLNKTLIRWADTVMQGHLQAFVNNFIRRERRERLNWLISRKGDEKRWFQAKLELLSFSPVRHDLRYATRLTDDESLRSKLLRH